MHCFDDQGYCDEQSTSPAGEKEAPYWRSRHKAHASHKSDAHGTEHRNRKGMVDVPGRIRKHGRINCPDQHDGQCDGKARPMHSHQFDSWLLRHGVFSAISASSRAASFSPHIALRTDNNIANPTPNIQVKYHITNLP